jgi:serine/threonine protein kinase
MVVSELTWVLTVAANVLVHEEGGLQLCDFGVATVLEKKTDKRKTFIGTLHWMPPELWNREPEYSDEVSECLLVGSLAIWQSTTELIKSGRRVGVWLHTL